MRARGTRKKPGLSLTLHRFQACCANGQAMLALLRHIPAETRDLLIRSNATAKDFKVNTMACNLVLSFTSMNSDLGRGYANEKHKAKVDFFHHSSRMGVDYSSSLLNSGKTFECIAEGQELIYTSAPTSTC